MKSIVNKKFNTNKIKIWNTITEDLEININENTIEKIEIIEKIIHQKYRVNIENKKIKGYFIITIEEKSPNVTDIIFEVSVKAKNVFYNIGLKKKIVTKQIEYIKELTKKLNIFNIDIDKINNVNFNDKSK